MKRKGTYIALLAAALLFLPSLASALSTYQNAFNKLYAIKATTALGKCTLCHKGTTTTRTNLNPYAKSFAAKHKGTVTVKQAFKAIEKIDSDKDTFTNIAEIKAGTKPGVKSSKPAAVAAAAAPVSAATADIFASSTTPKAVADPPAATGTSNNDESGCNFASTGRTPYFVLEPGYQLIISGSGDGSNVQMVLNVLDETRSISFVDEASGPQSVEARVVEGRQIQNGELVQVSRQYLAVCEESSNIFSFGEDTENYKGGEVDENESWEAGANGAMPRLLMPGIMLLGQPVTVKQLSD